MKERTKNQTKVDWIIHFLANGAVCDCCGKAEYSFPDYMCNAHTHGMNRYHHPEFQVVLNYGEEHVMYLLNTMGLKVQAGEKFKDGDVIADLYEDCTVRLIDAVENGEHVLRLVIPDQENRFPEDPNCSYPHNAQIHFSTK